MERDGKTTKLSRRAFLRASLGGAGAALLAACGSGGAATAPTAVPAAPATAAPAPATAAPAPATAAPAAATAAPAAATAAPAAATAAPAATAAAPAPTNTPAPLPVGSADKFTVIHRTEYFEQPQKIFRDTVTQFVQSKNVPLDISTANPEVFGDFMAKMQAAVQAGVPPDLGYHSLNITQMQFLDIVEDVSDVVEEAIQKYGAVVPVVAEKNAKIDGKWWAVPFMSNTGAWFARRDIFEAAGIDVDTLDTYDKRRDAALAVSDPSKEIWGWGLTINKSGDGHGVITGVIQAFGGRFVDETGTKVTFNSPETLAAVKWMQETYTGEKYKPMLPPGIESWTDTSNNEAFLAGKAALTLNAFSVYGKAKLDKNPIFPNIAVLRAPVTNDGQRLESGGNGWFTIFKGSKNVDLAKETILHLLDPQNFMPMVQGGGGLFLPAYKNLWTDEVLAVDPNFAILKEILFNPVPFTGQAYPADPNPAIAGIDAQAITSQMMTNVTTGQMTPEEAVQDAHERIVQIFEELGLPQS